MKFLPRPPAAVRIPPTAHGKTGTTHLGRVCFWRRLCGRGHGYRTHGHEGSASESCLGACALLGVDGCRRVVCLGRFHGLGHSMETIFGQPFADGGHAPPSQRAGAGGLSLASLRIRRIRMDGSGHGARFGHRFERFSFDVQLVGIRSERAADGQRHRGCFRRRRAARYTSSLNHSLILPAAPVSSAIPSPACLAGGC